MHDSAAVGTTSTSGIHATETPVDRNWGWHRALVGRRAELAALEGFLRGIDHAGGALLLTGPAGIGKTALLSRTAALAGRRGLSVWRVSGVKAEADIAFAAFHQVLMSLQDQVATLSRSRRAVLGRVHAPEVPPALEAGQVAEAMLDLLRAAARGSPALLIVDDAQWLDGSSAAVVGAALRAATGSHMGVLVATREGLDALLDPVAGRLHGRHRGGAATS
jgi:hypothetical protein